MTRLSHLPAKDASASVSGAIEGAVGGAGMESYRIPQNDHLRIRLLQQAQPALTVNYRSSANRSPIEFRAYLEY
jgi:hypothetical protein